MKKKKNFDEDLSTKIKILTPLEQKQYYGLPEFSPEQKKHNFFLDKQEYDLLKSLKSINSKVLFILELGYFKVKQRFFSFKKEEVLSDIEFIIKTYFPKARLAEINFSKNTKTAHRQSILNIFSYKDWKPFKKEFVKKGKILSQLILTRNIFLKNCCGLPSIIESFFLHTGKSRF